MFVNKGSIMIVSKRDFQDGVCDILYVYKDNQTSLLKKRNLIPSTHQGSKEDENVFEYDDDEEDKDNGASINKNKVNNDLF